MARPHYEDVLEFWFPPGLDTDLETHVAQYARWFRGTPDVDRVISERFRDTWEEAVRGGLDEWASSPRGRLALVLVLDQFSRNLARGTPAAYAQDGRAQGLALPAIESDVPDGIPIWELQFFAIALAHSEDLALHDKMVPWIERMVATRTPAHLRPLYEASLRQPRGHREVIRRFGRHPQRNAVLGRESTPEELEYLAGTPVHLRRIDLRDLGGGS
jgi:uncharacterized protein (DUF924 family)